MVPGEPPAARQCGGWALCDCCCWLLLPALLLLLLLARPDKLAAFPTSLSDCQTPTGWNCSGTRRHPARGAPVPPPSLPILQSVHGSGVRIAPPGWEHGALRLEEMGEKAENAGLGWEREPAAPPEPLPHAAGEI